MDELDMIRIANDVYIGCRLWLYYALKGQKVDDDVLRRFKDFDIITRQIGISRKTVYRLQTGIASIEEVREVMRKADEYATRKLLEIHAEWLEYLRLRNKFRGL